MADVTGAFNVFEGWGTLSVIAAFLSVLVAILLIMISRIFQDTRLEQSAKTEFIFAASTVVIVVVVVALLPVVDQISVGVINSVYAGTQVQHYAEDISQQPIVIDYALAVMDNIADCMKRIMYTLWAVDIIIEAVSSVVMEVFMSELATGYFFKQFSERITNSTNMLTFYFVIFYVVKHILVFLKYLGLSFFTMGVVMRAFPPTRGAGAFLMALVIGLYYVFPMSFVLMSYITTSYVGECGIPFASSLPMVGDAFSVDINDLDTIKPAENACQGTDYGQIQEYQLYAESEQGFIDQISKFAEKEMSRFALNLCFLPLLAFVITLSFVLSTSSLFGATIPEVGRGLVKLI
ncbi:hypothetical protein JXB01_04075 [Candidatus Micrarchaeota archaeon]|nr:hypothetical protein [Candidatus Micrarchaeota archaeon]